jgi:pimeloyl-ACP methyl ester carboxylesterase
MYEERIGPARASFDFRVALADLDVDLLGIHSADDERFPLGDSEEFVRKCRRGEFVVVHGLSHRRSARDPAVVARIADFVSHGASDR